MAEQHVSISSLPPPLPPHSSLFPSAADIIGAEAGSQSLEHPVAVCRALWQFVFLLLHTKKEELPFPYTVCTLLLFLRIQK